MFATERILILYVDDHGFIMVIVITGEHAFYINKTIHNFLNFMIELCGQEKSPAYKNNILCTIYFIELSGTA